MIKFINVEALLLIRNEVLREGRLKPQECRFPGDESEGAFHIGSYEGEELTCVASFHPKSYDGYVGTGYQLRGMATIEKYRGQGLGKRLLNFGMVYLGGKNANYLWCNARKTALPFYLGMSFEIISPEFEVAGIGPHRVLYVKIS